MKRKLPILFICLFALVGLIDSSLFHLKEIAGLTNPAAFASCSLSTTINCASVANSSYSHLLGMPVSQLGMYFYEAMLILSLTLLSGWTMRRWMLAVITAICAGAISFSYYLIYMSWFGVGALCPYCLVSAFSTTILSVSWLFHLLPILKRTKDI